MSDNRGPAFQSGPAVISPVGPEATEEVLAMIRAGFGSREVLDPPATALDETSDSVREALARHGGLLARSRDGEPVGALLFEPDGDALALRRVSVHPDAQGLGVARAMVQAAERLAVDRDVPTVRVSVRAELPRTVHFCQHLGYVETARDGVHLTMAREVPFEVTAATAEDARALGVRLAPSLAAGDVVLVAGDLGAGKTTLAQGIGAGLGVRGQVTSPTFVISRVHPSLRGGPALVHVDAYRLGGPAEVDDLDLDASLEDSVTVVEWGGGVAEGLSENRLEVTMVRSHGDESGEERRVRFVPVGARWLGSGLLASLR